MSQWNEKQIHCGHCLCTFNNQMLFYQVRSIKIFSYLCKRSTMLTNHATTKYIHWRIGSANAMCFSFASKIYADLPDLDFGFTRTMAHRLKSVHAICNAQHFSFVKQDQLSRPSVYKGQVWHRSLNFIAFNWCCLLLFKKSFFFLTHFWF